MPELSAALAALVTQKRRPREYRSQKMPGQKTVRWAIAPDALTGMPYQLTVNLHRLVELRSDK
ncbi:hypothetical protein FYK55_19825 [Roseiconus nitratireducens]|uniref:Uncharacterized protein n=1 Tax=Roseiconus nitratireducens TaxID=2605748 RepID=A0A5M6D0S4_9BACT|nr:hypothetical protein [Roseiconus nitratireducens]KAA5540646.1 hypothetical protein FYK55_19825 [Roseiconus nitratireducens]